tara:strand:+ start:10203 stop:11237 length:1035 start_codon:yes stop_codon:yes gene_type:complete
MAQPPANITANVNESIEKGTKAVESLTGSVTDTIKNNLPESEALLGLLIVIVVAGISVFILYWLIMNKLFNKKSITIEKTKIPVKGYEKSDIPIESMPLSKNGFKKTYTFWIYLDNMNTGRDQYKHVFHIGSDTDDITSGSPYVFLGKNKNELFIRFAKKDTENDKFKEAKKANSATDELKSLHNSLDDDLLTISDYSTNKSEIDSYMFQGVKIDYLPMQRWVHVAVVVNESLSDGSGGIIYVYLDSELTSTTKTYTGSEADEITPFKDLDNLELDRTGSLIVGGTGKSDGDFGFNGLLSKVKLYNYDLNYRDIYNDYSDGPIDGYLAALGYGVRAPIYKLADI